MRRPNNHATVPVLHCARRDFGGRSGILVHHDYKATVGKKRFLAARRRHKVVTRGIYAFCIYRQAPGWQELSEDVGGSVKVTSAVVNKIQYELGHSLLFQLFDRLRRLLVRICSEAVDAYVAGLGIGHIGRVNAVDRYVGTRYGEVERVGRDTLLAQHLDVHLRPFLAAQTLHDVGVLHLHPGDGRVVDCHYTVSGQDSDSFRRPSGHSLYHIQGVLVHIERYPYAAEVALQRLVKLFRLLRRGVGRMRVEPFQHALYGIFHEPVFIHGVHVELGYGGFSHTELVVGRHLRLRCGNTCRNRYGR